MGELSKSDAESRKTKYIKVLNDVSSKVEKHFTDMDFENADKRTKMEESVSEIKRICNNAISQLNGMSFQ